MRLDWELIDFETVSGVDLKVVGAARYAEDPTTDIICLWGSYMGKEPWGWHPGESLDYLRFRASDPECMFLAFNAFFERMIWRYIMVPLYGMPDVPVHRWHDIQAAASMKAMPAGLDKLLLTIGATHLKDKTGNKLTKSLSKAKKGKYDRTASTLSRVDDYCKEDILGELEAHQRLGWLPAGERGVWLRNQALNDRGIRIDLEYVRQCQLVVDRTKEPLLKEFSNLTGGLTPDQVKEVAGWCVRQGVRIPDLTKATIKEWLGFDIDEDGDEDENELARSDDFGIEEASTHEPVRLPDNVRRVLTIRQLVGSSSIKKLSRMAACVNADGRARGLLQYHGTGPGRPAGRLFQPTNFPRPTLKLDDKPIPPEIMVPALMTGDPEHVNFTCGPSIQAVGQGLRHALVPDRGKLFVSGDYAGIQLRVLLALSGQHDTCAKLLVKGYNAYCDMAEKIYHRKIDKHNDVPEYTIGKNSVLGLGFQMGWKTFKRKYAGELSDDFLQNVVRVYRKEWAPKVPYCWYGLSDAATEAVWKKRPVEAYGCLYKLEDGWLSVRLPSGRKLWYWNPVPIMSPVPWDENEKREAFRYTAWKGGRPVVKVAFGGGLTENVVMGIECDINRYATKLLEEAGYPVVLDVYDELVTEVEEARADEKAIKQIMETVPPWVKAMQVPIEVEMWTGDRYRK
jgi:DNA polymerase